VGHDVDVSLFDVALSNLGYLAAWYLNEGVNQGREARIGHPSIVPSQLYRTEDGWIFIMCNKEKFWGILCDALGRPEWKDDAEFATPAARLRNRTRVTRTTDAWLADFGGKIAAAPVRDVAGALDNPLVREEGRLMTLAHSSGRPFQLVGNPMRVPGEVHPNRPAPALGADTDAVLEELGYDAARRSALRRCGAIH
jgi:crotonobetainyl-CoA:carnitine CoA-transferase CaiB-like acyl-CoA transferase